MAPAAEAAASVILLHGLGADGHDFEPVAAELDLPLPVRWVFPHAPVRAVTINGGYRMRAWYDILGFDAHARQDEAGIRQSEAATRALVLREAERGVPAGRVVLAGFSQGGAIALHTALRHPVGLAGVVVLSSYLPLGSRLEEEAHPANAATPVFMGHGTEDGVVPLRNGLQTRDLLLARGSPVEWHEYPMPHTVSPAELRDLGAWLRRVLGQRQQSKVESRE